MMQRTLILVILACWGSSQVVHVHSFTNSGSLRSMMRTSYRARLPLLLNSRSRFSNIKLHNKNPKKQLEEQADNGEEDSVETKIQTDTVRVMIWRALSSHDELSMRELGSLVGERRMGDLKSHLVHVEKQAKTFGNKSKEWKVRRGLKDGIKRVKIKKRKDAKGVLHIRLE